MEGQQIPVTLKIREEKIPEEYEERIPEGREKNVFVRWELQFDTAVLYCSWKKLPF